MSLGKLPHIITNPATLGEVSENIRELADAVCDRIKAIPAFKAAHMQPAVERVKQESRHYLKMLRANVEKLEQEIQR